MTFEDHFKATGLFQEKAFLTQILEEYNKVERGNSYHLFQEIKRISGKVANRIDFDKMDSLFAFELNRILKDIDKELEVL